MVLDLYAEQRPIFVFGFLVGDDMDRASLTFRGWPKPYFALTDKGLKLDGPVTLTPDEFLAAHPPAIHSYAWRYLVHGTHVLPASLRTSLIGRTEAYQEIRLRARRILTMLSREFQKRGLEGFVLLFHGQRGVRTDKRPDWRNEFARKELARLKLPFVETGPLLVEDSRATGRPLDEYFLQEGKMRGHHNTLGNEVIFRALLKGLKGEFARPGAAGKKRPRRAPEKQEAAPAQQEDGD